LHKSPTSSPIASSHSYCNLS